MEDGGGREVYGAVAGVETVAPLPYPLEQTNNSALSTPNKDSRKSSSTSSSSSSTSTVSAEARRLVVEGKRADGRSPDHFPPICTQSSLTTLIAMMENQPKSGNCSSSNHYSNRN